MPQSNVSAHSVNVRVAEGLTFIEIDDGVTRCEYGIAPDLLPVDEIDLWVHEFSEFALYTVLKRGQPNHMSIPISISIVPYKCMFRVQHLMVSLHTSSIIRIKRNHKSDLRIVMNPEQLEGIVKFHGRSYGENSPLTS